MIYDWIRDGRAIDGGESCYLTPDDLLVGRKRKVETPTGGWYRFYNKLSVNQTGMQAGQLVL